MPYRNEEQRDAHKQAAAATVAKVHERFQAKRKAKELARARYNRDLEADKKAVQYEKTESSKADFI